MIFNFYYVSMKLAFQVNRVNQLYISIFFLHMSVPERPFRSILYKQHVHFRTQRLKFSRYGRFILNIRNDFDSCSLFPLEFGELWTKWVEICIWYQFICSSWSLLQLPINQIFAFNIYRITVYFSKISSTPAWTNFLFIVRCDTHYSSISFQDFASSGTVYGGR